MAGTGQKLSMTSKESLLAHALGHAVSRWANVEFGIVSVFATATGMKPSMAAAILRNVKTFSLLLDMCHSAVQHRLRGAPELIYWNSLVKYAGELSGDRNYMAHNSMVLHAPGPPETTPEHLVEPKIGPNVLAALAGEGEKRGPLDEAEITALLEDFQHLVELFMDFDKALKAHATSQEKYRGPVVRRRPPRSQRLEAARREGGSPP